MKNPLSYAQVTSDPSILLYVSVLDFTVVYSSLTIYGEVCLGTDRLHTAIESSLTLIHACVLGAWVSDGEFTPIKGHNILVVVH